MRRKNRPLDWKRKQDLKHRARKKRIAKNVFGYLYDSEDSYKEKLVGRLVKNSPACQCKLCKLNRTFHYLDKEQLLKDFSKRDFKLQMEEYQDEHS